MSDDPTALRRFERGAKEKQSTHTIRGTRLFLRFSILCMGVMFGACLTAYAVGAHTGLPTAMLQQGFMICSPPCLMDVTPGLTQWQIVQTRFTGQAQNTVEYAGQLLRSRSQPSAIILTLPQESEITFHRSIDAQHLGRIHYWSPNEHTLSLGWIIMLYGQPCAITLYPQAKTVTIRYPFLLVNIDIPPAGLTAQSAPITLDFTDPAFKPDFQPDLCIDNVTAGAVNLEWQGISRLRHVIQSFDISP